MRASHGDSNPVSIWMPSLRPSPEVAGASGASAASQSRQDRWEELRKAMDLAVRDLRDSDPFLRQIDDEPLKVDEELLRCVAPPEVDFTRLGDPLISMFAWRLPREVWRAMDAYCLAEGGPGVTTVAMPLRLYVDRGRGLPIAGLNELKTLRKLIVFIDSQIDIEGLEPRLGLKLCIRGQSEEPVEVIVPSPKPDQHAITLELEHPQAVHESSYARFSDRWPGQPRMLLGGQFQRGKVRWWSLQLGNRAGNIIDYQQALANQLHNAIAAGDLAVAVGIVEDVLRIEGGASITSAWRFTLLTATDRMGSCFLGEAFERGRAGFVASFTRLLASPAAVDECMTSDHRFAALAACRARSGPPQLYFTASQPAECLSQRHYETIYHFVREVASSSSLNIDDKASLVAAEYQDAAPETPARTAAQAALDAGNLRAVAAIVSGIFAADCDDDQTSQMLEALAIDFERLEPLNESGLLKDQEWHRRLRVLVKDAE